MENSKVKLRQINLNDTKNILKWKNNINVKKNFCIQNDLTEKQHINWYKNKVKKGLVYQFIIIDKDTYKDVGSIYLRDIDKKNKKAELGIFIGEDFARGKGLGTESIKEIVKYGFEKLNLHKIFLRVFANNVAGIRAYEKSGFKYEGTAKDDILLDNGKYQDIVFMSIIKK